VALITVGAVLLLVTVTARLTLLNRDFDTNVVAHTNAYERQYTEVLPSPGAQRLLTEALADVPVDATYLTANVRLLLLPDVLERVTTRALGAYVDYLLGDRSSIDPLEVLQPVVDHVVALVRSLLPELIVQGRQAQVSGLSGLETSLQSLLTQIGGGHVDLAIPTLPVPHQLQGAVTAVLTSGLRGDDRQVVSEQVTALLRDGDLNGALTIVVQNYVEHDPQLITTLSRASPTSRASLSSRSWHRRRGNQGSGWAGGWCRWARPPSPWAARCCCSWDWCCCCAGRGDGCSISPSRSGSAPSLPWEPGGVSNT